MMEDLLGYIEDLFEDIREDGRYDPEAVREREESLLDFMSLSETDGYDMTPEEHKKYMMLLDLKVELRDFERSFYRRLNKIVDD